MTDLTVYVDELLILNLYISFFLLLSTEKLVHRKVLFWRRMISSAVSSLFSLYIFLPEIHFLLSALARLVMSAAIVALHFGIKHRRIYFKSLFIFWLANFIFAGIMYGLWQLFLPNNIAINNSFVYISISPLMLIGTTVVCYMLISLYRKLTGKDKPEQLYYDLCFYYEDNAVTVKALLDTGNSLHDAFCDRPVVVIPFEIAAKLLPKERHSHFDCIDAVTNPPTDMVGYRLVPFSSVGAKGILPAFTATCRKANSAMTPITVTLAVNPSRLHEEYDVIIGLGLSQCLEE